MKYAYYPGCSARKSATEVDLATRKVLPYLGLAYQTLEEAACCGSREAGGLPVADPQLSLALNARTLAQAEMAGCDTIFTVCSTCQMRLSTDNLVLQASQDTLNNINGVLKEVGLQYTGRVKVKPLLKVLMEDIGWEKIKAKVKRNLKGLKIAPYYGCHALRPAYAHDGEDAYAPTLLSNLLQSLGAAEVHYQGMSQCCGFHSLFVKEEVALKLTGRRLKEARDCGADAIVTLCPLCHSMLDSYQEAASKEVGIKVKLPILHLPQIIGYTLGFEPEELGCNLHMVPVSIL